jgi:beta-lactam-binding protein with PASTA domain
MPAEPPPVNARIIQAPRDTTPIITPDLVGMTLPDARGVLNNLRLRTVVTRDTSSFQPPNTVIRQDPAANSPITAGESVTLTVSYFPPDSTSNTIRVPRTPAPPTIRPAADSLH